MILGSELVLLCLGSVSLHISKEQFLSTAYIRDTSLQEVDDFAFAAQSTVKVSLWFYYWLFTSIGTAFFFEKFNKAI